MRITRRKTTRKNRGVDMRFVDLFSGIGGFRLGLERVGMECVYSVENDKFARRSYEQIFGEEPTGRDIQNVRGQQLPEAEIVTAGFPCQSFSSIGNQGGLEDSRGGLFFEVVRIIGDVEPNFFVLENVEGLLSHNSGRTYGKVKNKLGELGYITERKTLNSRDFGLPQRRKRVFIVGYNNTECAGKILCFSEKKKNITETNRRGRGKIVNCIDANYYKGVDKKGQRTLLIENKFVRDEEILSSGKCPNHRETRFKECDCLGESSKFYDSSSRRLTPKECWRLQGFPDWAFELAQEVNSDTQLYKQAGNSVTVDIVEEIGNNISVL